MQWRQFTEYGFIFLNAIIKLQVRKWQITNLNIHLLAMAQAVSSRPLSAEARVRSRVSPCGNCGGQSGTWTGFSPSTSVFSCQFHSTGAPLKWKSRQKPRRLHHLPHRVTQ
jgi:hypothetical protein